MRRRGCKQNHTSQQRRGSTTPRKVEFASLCRLVLSVLGAVFPVHPRHLHSMLLQAVRRLYTGSALCFCAHNWCGALLQLLPRTWLARRPSPMR